jgi:hypothetical protein
MTDANPTETADAPHRIGTQIHFLTTGRLYAAKVGIRYESKMAHRGETLEITPALWEASLNSKGESWIARSEEDQIAKYGEIWHKPGPAPEGMSWWDPSNSAEKQIAYDAARKAAYDNPDDEKRAIALAKIQKTFGLMRTSTDLRSF